MHVRAHSKPRSCSCCFCCSSCFRASAASTAPAPLPGPPEGIEGTTATGDRVQGTANIRLCSLSFVGSTAAVRPPQKKQRPYLLNYDKTLVCYRPLTRALQQNNIRERDKKRQRKREGRVSRIVNSQFRFGLRTSTREKEYIILL